MTFIDVEVFHALDNQTTQGDYVGLFRVSGEDKLIQINTDGPKVSAKMLRDIERDWFDKDLNLFAFEEWSTWVPDTQSQEQQGQSK